MPLQTGTMLYFSRAVVLAIYGDHPAAVKCTMTGSACPQCFTAAPDFAAPPANGQMVLRTETNMRGAKRRFEAELANSARGDGTAKATRKKARALGVDLVNANPWYTGARAHNWLFGPHPAKDNVYQAMPQLTLHGLDEGPVAKLCAGAVNFAIECSTDNHTNVR